MSEVLEPARCPRPRCRHSLGNHSARGCFVPGCGCTLDGAAALRELEQLRADARKRRQA